MSAPGRTARGKTPPGPPRSAAPRLFAKLATDRLSLLLDAAAQYGEAVRIVIGPKTLYLFNSPDHAKHVLADNAANYHKGIGLAQAKRALGDGLLTSEGELWRRQRRTIQPVFQHKRIAAQAGVVAEEGGKLVDRLKAVPPGRPVDVMREMTGLTLGVLGRTLLDADLGGFESVGHSFEAVQDQAMFEMVTLSMVPTWVPLPKQVRFRRARRDLQRVVDALLAGSAGGGDDVLSRLKSSGDSGPGARQRTRDELVTLLLAGHETTASTLGWSFHLLDRHPEVAARVRDEAREVLGDRPPAYDDLKGLRYTAMVVEEVMRLYPPVWILTRSAQHDDEVGGYHVPAGSDVLISPYVLHRNPRLWPDAERFDPGRMDPAGIRPPYAYLPFGAGPRFCVGNHLGMMEATFVLAMVMRDLRLTGVRGRAVVPEPMLSLRVKGGLPMTVGPA